MRLSVLFALSLQLHAAGPMQLNPIEGPWKAHLGDDASWAAAEFDDAAWAESAPFLPDKGFAWYRKTVHVSPERNGPFELWIPALPAEAEIYLNGQLSLQYGVPGKWFTGRFGTVPAISIPNARPDSLLTIAIRVRDLKQQAVLEWKTPLIGSPIAIGYAVNQDRMEKLKWTTGWLLLVFLQVLFGVGALLVWRRIPAESLYLWFGVAQLIPIWWSIGQFVTRCLGGSALWGLPSLVLYSSECVVWLFLFREEPSWPGWRKISLFPAVISVFATLAILTTTGHLHHVWWQLLASLLVVITVVLVSQTLLAANRERRRALMPLFVPWLIAEAGNLPWFLSPVLIWLGLKDWAFSSGFVIFQTPFYVDLSLAGQALSVIAMGGILLGRFARTTEERKMLAGELEAARQVQELLVPSTSAVIPGYEIEAVYLPAQQVGGDFFQILPLADCGLLVVAGDVSGKGLRAAMVVSLVVGALRNRHSDEPGMILAELNQVLLGQMGGGFVTCCCARLDGNGRVVIANAGHLAPWMNGLELNVECGLPLGLAEIVYEETQMELAIGGQLLFSSDGIVEAANAQGELFGFERTTAMSGKPASEIARAAQEFGQNDDITVVTVRRAG